jgi:hypothetical protein
MRRLGLLLSCLVAVVVPFLLGAGAALAGSGNGCPGSAGDSQYIDPLSCPKTTSTSTPPPPTTTTSPSSTTTTPPATVASATTTTSGSPTAHDPSGSLPHTGLDLWVAIALGLGLLTAGIAMRKFLPSGG